MTSYESKTLQETYDTCLYLHTKLEELKEEILSMKAIISRLEKELIGVPADNTLVREYDDGR